MLLKCMLRNGYDGEKWEGRGRRGAAFEESV